MFVQNQIEFLPNHKKIIVNEIKDSDELLFVVAYVRENGVDIILDKIKKKKTKLLCSFDMGITQLSGIKKLLDNNVEIRVYKSNKGTFHPKIWLFGKNKNWKALIGSANLTRAALVDNVEASVFLDKKQDKDIINNSLIFFNYLWENTDKSFSITKDEVAYLQEKIQNRKHLKREQRNVKMESTGDKEKISVLFDYVKSWIDIDKSEHISDVIGSLWRGWYIIPDQGYINDRLVKQLVQYLAFIDDNKGIILSKSKPSKNYKNLLDIFIINSQFSRKNHSLTAHDLFVRQSKNYLIKFGWVYHPIKNNGKLNKKELRLTSLGIDVKRCDSLDCVKSLYSLFFDSFTFNGLYITPFVFSLLDSLDYLTLNEINYFVIHAYNNDDYKSVKNLINLYRSLSKPSSFDKKFKEYFDNVKGPTGKSVLGNYKKKVKHTMSVIGWHKDVIIDLDNFIIRKNEN